MYAIRSYYEFEGNSSWGYNPNNYFAPDKAYGTKDDLKELIDSIHNRRMIVIQDMVLNHAYNRITSYNVCYTKLLRITKFISCLN